ncbi:MAG: 1,6-anhydro-N-acetylmuramyl-L-alanine amidase AmpD [Pseudomonadota bacterium]
MKIERGLLDIARQCNSPNADERPDGEISLIVVHNISLPPGQFGGAHIDALFTNTLDPTQHAFFAEICELRVSAHVLIRRDGELVQYVPFEKRAWHAGVSHYAGRERCNDFSVGIELEGTDHVPFEESQYQTLASVVATLINTYPTITCERIVGHSDIAPGRKTDPGPAFNWAHFRGLLDGQLNRLAEK